MSAVGSYIRVSMCMFVRVRAPSGCIHQHQEIILRSHNENKIKGEKLGERFDRIKRHCLDIYLYFIFFNKPFT